MEELGSNPIAREKDFFNEGTDFIEKVRWRIKSSAEGPTTMKVTKEKEEQEELIRTESNDYEIDNETKPPWSGFLQKDEGETQ